MRWSSRAFWGRTPVSSCHRLRFRLALCFGLMDPDVREYLDRLAGMIAREFAHINGRLDGHDSRFERIELRLDGIDARLKGHDRRLDRLDAEVHDLRREMKSGFAVLTRRLEALEERV